MITGCTQDLLLLMQSAVDHLGGRNQRPERRQRTNLQQRELAPDLILGRQPQLTRGTEERAQLVKIQPLGGGDRRDYEGVAVATRRLLTTWSGG